MSGHHGPVLRLDFRLWQLVIALIDEDDSVAQCSRKVWNFTKNHAVREKGGHWSSVRNSLHLLEERGLVTIDNCGPGRTVKLGLTIIGKSMRDNQRASMTLLGMDLLKTHKPNLH